MWRWIFLALATATSTAHAAAIEVTSLGVNKPLVMLRGEIEAGDKDAFLQKIDGLSGAIVAFHSDGGNLTAGLQIGEAIRANNLTTLVPDNARCASACALAWLGGAQRLMGPRALVGFHAAYDRRTLEITSTGNALVGAYLNKMGLNDQAVIYITSTPPKAMRWLTRADAEKLGIRVTLFTAETSVALPSKWEGPHGPAASSTSPEETGITGGYVVQVTSQRSEADAQAAYRQLQTMYPLLRSRAPIVQRADTGANGVFYRAIVGPFSSSERALEFCNDLTSLGGRCAVAKQPPRAQ